MTQFYLAQGFGMSFLNLFFFSSFFFVLLVIVYCFLHVHVQYNQLISRAYQHLHKLLAGVGAGATGHRFHIVVFVVVLHSLGPLPAPCGPWVAASASLAFFPRALTAFWRLEIAFAWSVFKAFNSSFSSLSTALFLSAYSSWRLCTN